MKKIFDAVVLFSGGLDSLLAAKMLEAQNLDVLCIHFVSPFFGNNEKILWWQNNYGLNIEPVDIGDDFCQMLVDGPEFGFGKHLNPCMDCKILQLNSAKKIMEERCVQFVATGEVAGQRPMSQRKDALNLILKKTGLKDILLRPLSAKLLEPTYPEKAGIVKREMLENISGRGRQRQFELARQFGIKDMPLPGGGCLLTEAESCRRYWHILKRHEGSSSDLKKDFYLGRIGRQYFKENYWLCVGRNAEDNEKLKAFFELNDICLELSDFPGPFALAKNGITWPEDIVKEACSITLSRASKALKMNGEIAINIRSLSGNYKISAYPFDFAESWMPKTWDEIRKQMKLCGKNII